MMSLIRSSSSSNHIELFAGSKKETAQEWAAKEISLNEAASKIHNGSKIYIGSCGATPEATLEALVDDWNIANIQIIQMIPGGTLPHLKENLDRFRTSSFYSFAKTGFFDMDERATQEGLKDYTPVGINQVPRLLEEKKLLVDVAISKSGIAVMLFSWEAKRSRISTRLVHCIVQHIPSQSQSH